MGKRELEIIDNLGRLYPTFPNKYGLSIKYKDYQRYNSDKAWWVYTLCVDQLKRRLPRLENFMKKHGNKIWWEWYKEDFGIEN